MRVKIDTLTKGFVHGVGEVHLLPLPTAEEERLVLANRTAVLEAVLVQLDDRFLKPLRLGVELIRVQRRVAEEFKCCSMELVSTATRGYRHIRSRVPSLLRRGIGRGYFELLHVIRIEPENIVHGVRVRTLVGVNAVDRHIYGTNARAIHANGATGALHDAGLIDQ